LNEQFESVQFMTKKTNKYAWNTIDEFIFVDAFSYVIYNLLAHHNNINLHTFDDIVEYNI